MLGFKDHLPETEEYNISSFVYRERRPFNPLKLQEFINHSWPGVIGAKGFFWRPHHVRAISQAGALVRTSRYGLLVDSPVFVPDCGATWLEPIRKLEREVRAAQADRDPTR